MKVLSRNLSCGHEQKYDNLSAAYLIVERGTPQTRSRNAIHSIATLVPWDLLGYSCYIITVDVIYPGKGC
jgi:hypothetical protein